MTTEQTIKYPTGNYCIPEDVFRSANHYIDNLAKFLTPSGSNGKMPAFLAGIDSYFKVHNINPQIYWTESWDRAGGKDMESYNIAKRAIVQPVVKPKFSFKVKIKSFFSMIKQLLQNFKRK